MSLDAPIFQEKKVGSTWEPFDKYRCSAWSNTIFKPTYTCFIMSTPLFIQPPWPLTRSFKQRAPWWDYTQSATYGITLSSYRQRMVFGHEEEGAFFLSPVGEALMWFWRTLPDHTFMDLELLGVEVTSNALHAVLRITRPVGYEVSVSPVVAEGETVQFSSLAPKAGSLGHIIRGYKAAVTRSVRELGWWGPEEPLWQARYGDYIIRNEEEQAYYTALLLERSGGMVHSATTLERWPRPNWVTSLEEIQAHRRAARLTAQTEYSAAG